MSRLPRLAAVAAASVATLGALAMLAVTVRGDDPFADCRASRIAGGSGAIGGAFTLISETGARITEADILAGPSLIYFGYTFCPDICPVDVARNAEAADALEEMGHLVTPYMISVDPRRDTPEVLAEWTDYLHPRMIGLTGTAEEISVAGKAFKTYYKVPENPVDAMYLVDHLTHTYLMLPGHGFVEFFSREVSPADLAARAACFIDAA